MSAINKEITSTRQREIVSKKSEKLLAFIDALPFKVEIKGNPVWNNLTRRWHHFFILPEQIEIEFPITKNLDQ